MLHGQLFVLFYQNMNFTETSVNFDPSTVYPISYGDYYKKLAVYFYFMK